MSRQNHKDLVRSEQIKKVDILLWPRKYCTPIFYTTLLYSFVPLNFWKDKYGFYDRSGLKFS